MQIGLESPASARAGDYPKCRDPETRVSPEVSYSHLSGGNYSSTAKSRSTPVSGQRFFLRTQHRSDQLGVCRKVPCPCVVSGAPLFWFLRDVAARGIVIIGPVSEIFSIASNQSTTVKLLRYVSQNLSGIPSPYYDLARFMVRACYPRYRLGSRYFKIIPSADWDRVSDFYGVSVLVTISGHQHDRRRGRASVR